MRHEEENHWHPSDHHRQDDRRREHPRYREERHFNDFGSRWGEPDPRFNPRNQDWQQREEDRRREHRSPRNDWMPFEQQMEEQRRHSGQEYRERDYREPVWRQRDRHFNSSNQHADDRWQNGASELHSDQRRHPDEMEYRRRQHRDYLEE